MRSHPLRLPALALTATFLIALITVAVVISRSDENERVVKSTGLKLSSSQAHGREVFAQTCGTCHTLSAAKSVGEVGPNFDVVAPYGLDEEFVRTTIDEGMKRGNGTMPKEIVSGADADDVASFLSAVTRDEAAAKSSRQHAQVHTKPKETRAP